MKKRLPIYILILLPALLVGPVYGETVSMNISGVPNLSLSVDPTGRTEGYSAILYNNPNGLPVSVIAFASEVGSPFGLV